MTQFDDPRLREMYGDGFLKLPHGKTAQDVTEDYLRELYKFTVQKLEQELGVDVFRTMPMEVWITYPAIWSVKATEATKAAAKAAGFGSRLFDTFNMITEPEAAALVAMKPHLGLKAIDPVQVCGSSPV
jgi:molecular chaperone DnaK (HSP70)